LAKNTPFLTLFKKGQKIEIFNKKPKKTQKNNKNPFFKQFYAFFTNYLLRAFLEGCLKVIKKYKKINRFNKKQKK